MWTRDPRCPMGCSVQCGPAAPVCVETDASSWRGFLLWTHSSPGLLGCFRVVYTVQYSTVYSTVYSTTMPGLSAELGPMNGWSRDLATSYLVTLCWIVLKMGNLVSARNYGDHFHSTVQYSATHTIMIHCSCLLGQCCLVSKNQPDITFSCVGFHHDCPAEGMGRAEHIDNMKQADYNQSGCYQLNLRT